MPDSPLILYVVNNPAFFVSHRLPIASAAMKQGYAVHIACPDGAANSTLQSAGLTVHPLRLSRMGLQPLRELGSVISLLKLYRQLNPDLIHHITPKPNIYGGIAARLAGSRACVFAIAGMGYVFAGNNWKQGFLRPFVRGLYALALAVRNKKIIVQNDDDHALMMHIAGVKAADIELIPGSGVDLEKFIQVPEPQDTCTVVMAARLLNDKGVREFVEAARLLARKGHKARFILAGETDPGNPASVRDSQLNAWKASGIVECPGYVENVADLYARGHIVVLPSYYREGLPKSLIEAAACGRPVVTTDMPGCRDAVLPGRTGLLVPARDPEALASALETLLGDRELRVRMGTQARIWAEQKFSIDSVVERHLRIYNQLLELS